MAISLEQVGMRAVSEGACGGLGGVSVLRNTGGERGGDAAGGNTDQRRRVGSGAELAASIDRADAATPARCADSVGLGAQFGLAGAAGRAQHGPAV